MIHVHVHVDMLQHVCTVPTPHAHPHVDTTNTLDTSTRARGTSTWAVGRTATSTRPMARTTRPTTHGTGHAQRESAGAVELRHRSGPGEPTRHGDESTHRAAPSGPDGDRMRDPVRAPTLRRARLLTLLLFIVYRLYVSRRHAAHRRDRRCDVYTQGNLANLHRHRL